MGIWQRIREKFRSATASAFGSVFRSAGNVSATLYVPGLERPAEHLLWIYLGLKARSEAISQVPLRVTMGDDSLVESGPLNDLLDHPNSWMDGVQYLAMIESYLTLYDECQIAIVRGASRALPLELVPLNPRYVEPVTAVHTATGVRAPVGWSYRDPSTGEATAFAPEDVIPIVSYSPYDTTRALWPSTPGKRAMQIDILAQEQNLAIFKNGGMPDVVFETEQAWNKEQSEEFLERWQDRYGGTANAHKPGILYGGLKAKALGLSPADLQFFDGRRMSRQEQIALIRVKPAMVGLMEGETGLSQGSSTREQKAAWWSETGLYELARIAGAHQRYLVDQFAWAGSVSSREMTLRQRLSREAFRLRMRQLSVRAPASRGLSIWFDEHEIEELMEERLKKIDILGKLLDRGWRPDDVSDYLGLKLPPHPTNVATLPFSVQPLADLTAPQEPPPAREADAGPLRLDALLGELSSAVDAVAVAERGRDQEAEARERETSGRQRRLRKAFDAYCAKLQKPAARKWSRFFMEQRARVNDRMQEVAASTRQREEDPDINELDLSPDALLRALFPRNHEDEMLAARLSPLWTQLIRDGVSFFATTDMPGTPLESLQISDQRVLEAVASRQIQGQGVNETTEGHLRDILKSAFEEGDTIPQLSQRIDDYLKQAVGETSARPVVAARTQVAGLVNDGRMIAARGAGKLLKGWLHGAPEEARANHLDAQARYTAHPIGLDEKFILMGEGGQSYSCDAPGSTELPVGEVANCTCMVEFHPAGRN